MCLEAETTIEVEHTENILSHGAENALFLHGVQLIAYVYKQWSTNLTWSH